MFVMLTPLVPNLLMTLVYFFIASYYRSLTQEDSLKQRQMQAEKRQLWRCRVSTKQGGNSGGGGGGGGGQGGPWPPQLFTKFHRTHWQCQYQKVQSTYPG